MSLSKIESPQGALTIATEQATTSGTEFDFTGIPAGAKRITVIFNAVSLSGTDKIIVQIGDSGGIETTGYDSSSSSGASVSSATSTFLLRSNSASHEHSGHMTLTRVNSSHTWISSHSLKRGTSNVDLVGGGDKTLSGELTQVRITRDGTNTFDAGSVNIMYE